MCKRTAFLILAYDIITPLHLVKNNSGGKNSTFMTNSNAHNEKQNALNNVQESAVENRNASLNDEAIELDFEEPKEAFFDRLMKSYELSTIGKCGLNWPDRVKRYRSEHPIELGSVPIPKDLPDFLDEDIDLDVAFSQAMDTLMPIGTTTEGDNILCKKARKGTKKAKQALTAMGGPTTLALWQESPICITLTKEAFDYAKHRLMPSNMKIEEIMCMFSGHCFCFDMQNSSIPSPIDGLEIVGMIVRLTIMSLCPTLVYDLLLEGSNKFDVLTIPLYYTPDSMSAAQSKRMDVLDATPLDNPPNPTAYDWINIKAWENTAPMLDKILANFAAQNFEEHEVETSSKPSFVFFAPGEFDRLVEEAKQRKIEEKQQAINEAARKKYAKQKAEKEKQEKELQLKRQREKQRKRDIANLDNIKANLASAQSESKQLQAQVSELEENLEELKLAYIAQGAQLSKEQEQVGLLEGKISSMQHSTKSAEDAAQRESQQAAAVTKRAQLIEKLEIPKTPYDALLLARAAFPDKLYVTSNAEKTARDFTLGYVDETWNALRDMATLLYPIIFSDESADVVALFEAQSTFGIAMSEGPMTQKSPALMRLRKLNYMGKTVDMSAHVKGKNAESNDGTLRIHFYPDSKNKLLVIGHCGTHLPTYAYSGR